MSDQQGPNVGQQLGFGRVWQPTPFSWDWNHLLSGDGSKIYVLKIESPNGVQGFCFAKENLETLRDQISGLISPLQIAGPDALDALRKQNGTQ